MNKTTREPIQSDSTPVLEVGHRYYNALKGGIVSVDELIERGTYGIPPVISNLVIEAALNKFNSFPTVFLIGRIYKEELTDNVGKKFYRTIDSWREIVKQKVIKAGYIPLDGVSLDLHTEDVVAGAGRAFLHAYISPVGIVDGRARIGVGSLEGAKFVLSLGGNIGFIVKKKDYRNVVAFLEGRSKKYPECLPAYYGILDLESADIINDVDGVPNWLKKQNKLMTNKSFKERYIPKKIKTIIDYYSLFYARYRGDDIRLYENILRSIRKNKK